MVVTKPQQVLGEIESAASKLSGTRHMLTLVQHGIPPTRCPDIAIVPDRRPEIRRVPYRPVVERCVVFRRDVMSTPHMLRETRYARLFDLCSRWFPESVVHWDVLVVSGILSAQSSGMLSPNQARVP